MNPAEWLALGGLIRAMMAADGKLSLKEHRLVAVLAGRLGPELWTCLAEAELRLKDEPALWRQAAKVVDPEHRAVIRGILEEVALSDGLAPAEQALLHRLDELWEGEP